MKQDKRAACRGAPLPQRATVRPAAEQAQISVFQAIRKVEKVRTAMHVQPLDVRLLATWDALYSIRTEIRHPFGGFSSVAEAAVARIHLMRVTMLDAIAVDMRVGSNKALERRAAWRLEAKEEALAKLQAAASLDANGPDASERLHPVVWTEYAMRDGIASFARMLLSLVTERSNESAIA